MLKMTVGSIMETNKQKNSLLIKKSIDNNMKNSLKK